MAPVSDKGRRLLVPSEDPGIEFLEIKPGDVPIYVESGAADLGITGTDVLREANPDVLEPLELDFGQCRLVVAAPAGAAYPALPGGITPRLATKYPRLAREHFAAQGRGGGDHRGRRVGGSGAAARAVALDRGPGRHGEHADAPTDWSSMRRYSSVRATLIANRASQKLKLETTSGGDAATGGNGVGREQ